MTLTRLNLFTDPDVDPAAEDTVASSRSYLDAVKASVANQELFLSVPRKRIKANVPRRGTPAQAYRRDNGGDRALRTAYSVTRVHSGIARLRMQEREAADGDEISKSVAAVGKTALAAQAHLERHTDRLVPSHHAHHISDFGRLFAATCRDIRCGHATPRNMLLGLVDDVICRWLPAVQNTISHLPPAAREAAAAQAGRYLQAFLRRVASLHAVAGSAKERERGERWGYGALDAACIEVASMIGYVKDLAAQVVLSGAERIHPVDARSLQVAADAALVESIAAIDELAEQRFDALSETVWQHHKADMVAMAKRPDSGGISPDLEAIYHSPRSRFIGSLNLPRDWSLR